MILVGPFQIGVICESKSLSAVKPVPCKCGTNLIPAAPTVVADICLAVIWLCNRKEELGRKKGQFWVKACSMCRGLISPLCRWKKVREFHTLKSASDSFF